MNAKLLLGPSEQVLLTLEPDSIDSCVTDPPYELGFMGKTWDNSGIAYSVQFWQEVLRVLKPGAHLLAFGGTRTSHRMVCAIEDAGFEIRDSLQWIYGSGFPKSLNISKQIDKEAGAEREVIGSRPLRGNGKTMQGGAYHQPETKEDVASKSEEYAFTIPATDAAKQWNGWGTALKPAVEPICLARKSLSEKTVARNVLRHGTGGLNIDASRIGTDGGCAGAGAGARVFGNGLNGTFAQPVPGLGRWPANVLFDEESAALLDEQTGELTSGEIHSARNADGFRSSSLGGGKTIANYTSNSGGASRFFYVAKASTSERNEGLADVALPQRDISREAGKPGGENPRNRGSKLVSNHHPTVKPVDLMRYLVRLVTPPGGTVLDPFMGSGTTGIACQMEQFSFVGIEQEPEYLEIARKRMNAVPPSLFGGDETGDITTGGDETGDTTTGGDDA